MQPYRAAVAAFVIVGIFLFGLSLFLIGDQHKAFSHRIDLYTDLANVNGLIPGSHVRVSGYDAGQISHIEIPSRPSGKFRLTLHVDEKLKTLIRGDSVVTVETDGLVGDKFVLVHSGSERGQEVQNGATLPSKEPIELSALMEKVSGTIDQANATVGDVRAHLDSTFGRLDGTFDHLNGTLDAIKLTVNNTNGIVTGLREGHGPIGALLTDQQITDDLKGSIANTRAATANLSEVSVQAKQVMSESSRRVAADRSDIAAVEQQSLRGTWPRRFGPHRGGEPARDAEQRQCGHREHGGGHRGAET